MFKLGYDITYADGAKASVTTRPSTEVAFERKFGRTVTSLFTGIPVGDDGKPTADQSQIVEWFAERVQAEHTYFLAWHAARDTRPFDDWLETVDAIDWRIGESADPTTPAQPAS